MSLMPPSHPRRTGFTTIEVLVSVVILALLASVVIPAAYRRIADSYVNTMANDLSTIAQAINTYHDHVAMWPSTVGQLITAPAPGATNICAGVMAIADTARWRGPYLTIPVSTSGIQVDNMIISNTLSRSTSPAPTTLQITVTNVDATTDATLESLFDGSNIDNTSGVIRYNSGTSTLTFNLPITGC
jgi:prepilin-type N-terminal cleavage/methylation domain-containing protein